MIETQPKLGWIIDSAQDTVLKWMIDGDSKQKAIQRYESLLRCRIPDVIRNTIKERYE